MMAAVLTQALLTEINKYALRQFEVNEVRGGVRSFVKLAATDGCLLSEVDDKVMFKGGC